MAKIESITIQHDKRVSLDGIGKLRPEQGQGQGGGNKQGSGQSGQEGNSETKK